MSHSLLRIFVYIRIFIFILFSFINEISEAAHFRVLLNTETMSAPPSILEILNDVTVIYAYY